MTRRLATAGCVAAREEAAALIAAANDVGALEAMVRRREDGEPLAWITGRVQFGGRTVSIRPGVFVPRPQTEELARRAAARLAAGGRVADLCAGSGAIAAHLQVSVQGATVVAVDLDPLAAACARANGVPAVVGDLGAPLRSHAFDLVTAVAPYVPTAALDLLPSDVRRHEPTVALDGGPDGLRLVERAAAVAARLLRPGGALLLEIGGDQEAEVRRTLVGHGFTAVGCWYDEDDDLRGIEATAP